MVSQVVSQQENRSRRPFQADGLFCAVCGLAFTLDAEPIRAFAGLESSSLILVLGIGLLIYGVALFFLNTYRPFPQVINRAAIVGNVVWVVASVFLLGADPLHLSTGGKWALLVLTDVVALLAIWEFVVVRRLPRAA